MKNTIIASRYASSRNALLMGLLSGALPAAALLTPATAFAASAVNTATVTAPSGTFEANTANNSATDTDNVLAAIVATNDSASGVNGLAGATAVVNAFTGDTINGAAASSANASLSVASGSSVPAGLTFDTATGSVSVAAGTAAGTYSFDYTICEKANPTNCKTATISVTVVAAPIAADADTVSGINGASGASNVLDVIAGDTLNGTQVTLSQVNLTVTTPATPASSGAPVPTLDPATGQVSVPASTPAGTYTITYQICEKLNPSNCASNTATVTVAGATIVATNDSATGINGLTGATAVVNAFTSDTVNGAAASTANATLAVASGSSVPTGLTFDTATGNVNVAAGTPAGTYTFDYTLCEKLNPTNCKTATISVTVIAAPIAADADTVSGVNGSAGASNVLDVIAGDTLNGTQVTLSQVNLTVTTPATPAAPGDPVPTLDVATGQVSVPANTPAGTYTITYQICDKLNPTNCASSTATITVAPSVDLQVTKTDGLTDATSGQTVTYAITVTNLGPDTATGALVKDVPGTGLTCPATNALSFSGSGIPSGSFTFGDLSGAGVTLGSLSKNQSVTITYTCTVN